MYRLPMILAYQVGFKYALALPCVCVCVCVGVGDCDFGIARAIYLYRVALQTTDRC